MSKIFIWIWQLVPLLCCFYETKCRLMTVTLCRRLLKPITYQMFPLRRQILLNSIDSEKLYWLKSLSRMFMRQSDNLSSSRFLSRLRCLFYGTGLMVYICVINWYPLLPSCLRQEFICPCDDLDVGHTKQLSQFYQAFLVRFEVRPILRRQFGFLSQAGMRYLIQALEVTFHSCLQNLWTWIGTVNVKL